MLEYPPIARLHHNWGLWLVGLFTGGLSLAITLPSAFSKRKAAQRKIEQLWKSYNLLSQRLNEDGHRNPHLFGSSSMASSPSEVVLEEAREGLTTTTTDGEISLSGRTSMGGAGLGVGVGPIGIGVGGGSGSTRMSGNLSSTGVSKKGQDRATDIDEGQLTFTPNGLQFVGRLQVRDIPVGSIIQVFRERATLLVGSRLSSLVQRFRFKDAFEAIAFERALTEMLESKKFPDMVKLEAQLAPEARESVNRELDSIEKRMKKLAS